MEPFIDETQGQHKTRPNASAFGPLGLTVREHFAAMAMQGLLANRTTSFKYVPRDAVLYADALIQELNAPICERCNLSNADKHFDAAANLCTNEERYLSEQH